MRRGSTRCWPTSSGSRGTDRGRGAAGGQARGSHLARRGGTSPPALPASRHRPHRNAGPVRDRFAVLVLGSATDWRAGPSGIARAIAPYSGSA
jgi:hypothetical protein